MKNQINSSKIFNLILNFLQLILTEALAKIVLLCMMLIIVTSCSSHSKDLDSSDDLVTPPSEAATQLEHDLPVQQPTDEDNSSPSICLSERLPEELVQIVNTNREAFFKPTSDEAVAAAKSYQTSGLGPEKDAKIAEMLRKIMTTTSSGGMKSPIRAWC